MKRLLVCLLTFVSLSSLSACGKPKPVPAELTILNEHEEYGAITVEGEQVVGNTVTITVTPLQDDYVLDEWFEVVDTDRYPLDFHNPLNLKITEPKMTIEATWVPKYSEGLSFSAYPDEHDLNFTWQISEYRQVEGEKEITIPTIYHGRDVTRVGSGAFKNCDITKISLQNSITSIGEDAFVDTKMQSIRLPATLQDAANAFKSWKSEQTIYVPSNCIESVGDDYKTTWNWILTKDVSEECFTSSDTGEAHIIPKDIN
ncbi:MAG: leucine-rich repeat domain-containing protein [Bacilli bacterium]|nr:leucine-rich repeat domain-containing protein [Bacilli bacterium]